MMVALTLTALENAVSMTAPTMLNTAYINHPSHMKVSLYLEVQLGLVKLLYNDWVYLLLRLLVRW